MPNSRPLPAPHQERGNLETAQRVREAVQHVYPYSVDNETLDPARNFVNARTAGLSPPRSRHYAAITDPKHRAPAQRRILLELLEKMASLQLCGNTPVVERVKVNPG